MDQFDDVRVQMPENPRIFGDSGCPKKAQIGRFGIGPLEEYGGVLTQHGVLGNEPLVRSSTYYELANIMV